MQLPTVSVSTCRSGTGTAVMPKSLAEYANAKNRDRLCVFCFVDTETKPACRAIYFLSHTRWSQTITGDFIFRLNLSFKLKSLINLTICLKPYFSVQI